MFVICMFHICMCRGNGRDLVLRIIWFHKATDVARVWPGDSVTTYYSVVSLLNWKLCLVWIWFDQNILQNISIFLNKDVEHSVKLLLLTVLVNHSDCLLSLATSGFH